MRLTLKLKIDLKITHKLFPLVAFVQTQTSGLTNRLINPDVAAVSAT